jgi:hypothetical protein
MPQLPHRDSGTRNGKNTDDTALANTSEFCNTIGGKADITQTWRLPAKTPHAMDVGVRRYAAALPAA